MSRGVPSLDGGWSVRNGIPAHLREGIACTALHARAVSVLDGGDLRGCSSPPVWWMDRYFDGIKRRVLLCETHAKEARAEGRELFPIRPDTRLHLEAGELLVVPHTGDRRAP